MTGSKHDIPSKTLQRLRRDLEVREVLGNLKYNTTIDREDLDIEDWVKHAREEAMDLAMYLTRLLLMLEEKD